MEKSKRVKNVREAIGDQQHQKTWYCQNMSRDVIHQRVHVFSYAVRSVGVTRYSENCHEMGFLIR